MNFPFLVLLIALLSGEVTQAQSVISFGQIFYRGSGCPKGSVNLSFNPTQNELSIMFDQFIAEAGSATNKSVDEKSCSISIPIQLPENYSLSISQVEVQGFNLIPANGAINRFETDYFWNSIRGPSFSKIYSGSLSENFQETSALLANASIWTPCEKSTVLRANTNIRTQTNPQMDQTMMVLDSSDASAAMVLQIKLKKCGARIPTPDL